jgi:DNA-binding response OmpR family regulator
LRAKKSSKSRLLGTLGIPSQKIITFAQEDFDITYVDNGVDAINKAQTIKPDIVLADIVMPQKNGYDVCEAIKKNADLKHIPVLLLAGTFETFDVNRGKLVGADDYIIKPFESQALIDKVDKILTQ